MVRAWLVLAALLAGLARGQAPTYSADSIVNGANFAPGPFAPNSVITVFGANLSFGTAQIADGSTEVPEQLANVRVYVDNLSAPLIYVSPTQINLLVPSNLKAGTFPLRVVRQGITGAAVDILLMDAAPQLFAQNNYVIAQHTPDYSQVTPDSPARAGEVIVVYATGLGPTLPNPNPGEIPAYPGKITSTLQLSLGGSVVDSNNILYAGVTPGLAGVYQINLIVPDGPGGDLDIQVQADGQTSSPGVKLPTPVSTQSAAQPTASDVR